MPQYTLSWENRSHVDQDWQISNGDAFMLHANWVRNVVITINNTYTYQVAVSTRGGYAACSVTWTQGTQLWTLHSNTPNEWQLLQGGGTVRVLCFLENVATAPEYAPSDPSLMPAEPELDA